MIWAEVLGWLKGFLRDHWAKVGTAVAVVTLPLAIRGCVHGCPVPAVTTTSVTANQVQAGALTATAKVQIRYIQVPGKCPEIAIDLDSTATAFGSQAQGVTATAAQVPVLSASDPRIGVHLGGGYVPTLGIVGNLGLSYGKLRVDGVANTGLAWGAMGSWKVWEWGGAR